MRSIFSRGWVTDNVLRLGFSEERVWHVFLSFIVWWFICSLYEFALETSEISFTGRFHNDFSDQGFFSSISTIDSVFEQNSLIVCSGQLIIVSFFCGVGADFL